VALVDLDGDPGSLAPRVRGLRVFAGYAGWDRGQLAGEIARGDWYVVPALPDDVLAPELVMLGDAPPLTGGGGFSKEFMLVGGAGGGAGGVAPEGQGLTVGDEATLLGEPPTEGGAGGEGNIAGVEMSLIVVGGMVPATGLLD